MTNVALGGGLEVAMACNARVTNKGAQLGLPELQLGAAVPVATGNPQTSGTPAHFHPRAVRAVATAACVV